MRIANMLIVGFNTPINQSDGSTVELDWPGGKGRIEARLDVGGFEVAVTPDNAPRGQILLVKESGEDVLFDERTESNVVRTIHFHSPGGTLKFISTAPAAGAYGALRAEVHTHGDFR